MHGHMDGLAPPYEIFWPKIIQDNRYSFDPVRSTGFNVRSHIVSEILHIQIDFNSLAITTFRLVDNC